MRREQRILLAELAAELRHLLTQGGRVVVTAALRLRAQTRGRKGVLKPRRAAAKGGDGRLAGRRRGGGGGGARRRLAAGAARRAQQRRKVGTQAVGLGKPDPAIYQLFFERLLKLHPEATSADLCFVDDKEKNCAAALALGWRAINHDARKVGPGELRKRIVQELEL